MCFLQRRKLIITLIICVLFSTGPFCQKAGSEDTGESEAATTLTVAAASSLRYAGQELKSAFERETGIKTALIISSSGKLTAQIKQGAPYDVFLSADLKYPGDIFAENSNLSPPRVYARGTLVLWTTNSKLTPELSTLTKPAVRKIALANPETAPYGRAALQVLKRAGIYNAVKDKLIYGENVAQLAGFVIEGAADIALIAGSILAAPELRNKGRRGQIDPSGYDSIEQAALLLKGNQGAKGEKSGQKFLDFLCGPAGGQILKRYGFKTPDR